MPKHNAQVTESALIVYVFVAVEGRKNSRPIRFEDSTVHHDLRFLRPPKN